MICGFGQVTRLVASKSCAEGCHFWLEYTAPEYIATVLNLKKGVYAVGDNRGDEEEGFWAKADVWAFGMNALQVSVLKIGMDRSDL